MDTEIPRQILQVNRSKRRIRQADLASYFKGYLLRPELLAPTHSASRRANGIRYVPKPAAARHVRVRRNMHPCVLLDQARLAEMGFRKAL
jgi:hypothetical protein